MNEAAETIKVANNLDEINRLQGSLLKKKLDIDASFLAFKSKAEKAMNKVDSIVSTNFNHDPSMLEESLEETVAISHTIGQYLVRAEYFLTLYELMHFLPKSKDASENDRKLFTSVKVAPQTILTNQLKQIDKKLEKKITIGQSILKYETNRLMRE